MGTLALIVVMASCIYAVRLSGFVLARATIPERWERTLGYVPIATLTALVAASLAGRNYNVPHGVLVAGIAAGIAYVTRRVWACIVGGMLVYWLLAFIT